MFIVYLLLLFVFVLLSFFHLSEQVREMLAHTALECTFLVTICTATSHMSAFSEEVVSHSKRDME